MFDLKFTQPPKKPLQEQSKELFEELLAESLQKPLTS